MQQAQRCIEQIDQVRASSSRSSGIGTLFEIQSWLDQFQIPVAELSPEKIIDAIGRLVESVSRQRVIHVSHNTIKSRENPPVFQRCNREHSNASSGTVCVGRGLRP